MPAKKSALRPLRPKKRGRPRLSIAEEKEREKSWRQDGERITQALSALGFESQAEAARASGIPQNRLNEFVNGERDIRRDDLRKLARIGVSADYVLGFGSVNIPPGHARPQASIELDLQNLVVMQLRRELPPDRLKLRAEHDWVASGEKLLHALIDSAVADARMEADEVERRETLMQDVDLLTDFAERNYDRINAAPQPLTDEQQRELSSIFKLLKLSKRVSDTVKELAPAHGRPVLLAPTSIIKNSLSSPF